jgi:hydrogenase expression/formation protein HypE
MAISELVQGVTCPVPLDPGELVQLGHGSGGKRSAALFRERLLPHLTNPALDALGDAAIVSLPGHELALSTDSFVVRPLEFPGGSIGTLAVNGTVNDLAMMGAEPLWLSAGLILEEGFPLERLDRLMAAMGAAARAAGVPIVTGDTKVVERGKGDGLFINTTGVGRRWSGVRPEPARARPGDAVLVSGPIGRHGIAIMAARDELGFEIPIESDCACLWPPVRRLLESFGVDVHVLRDPTRGGVASALNEIAAASGVGIVLEETAIPVPDPVRAACDVLGLDPLYVANEGVFVAILPGQYAEEAIRLLRTHPLGAGTAGIGRVVADHAGYVVLDTALGGARIVDLLPGDQLPRIC